jgi:hypothetical protein
MMRGILLIKEAKSVEGLFQGNLFLRGLHSRRLDLTEREIAGCESFTVQI